MVRVRVGVFVILGDVLELFLANLTVEGSEDAGNLGLDCGAARDCVLQVGRCEQGHHW